jgi:glucosamine--fructose-6-phosphate aminotransferase (isomerizing)
MEKGVPVIALLSNDKVRHDVINSIDEVKARGAEVIGVSPTDYGNFDFWLPVPETGKTQAIMNIIPLQLLAYYVALELGNDIDKPRNIAKSVTVK